MASLITIVLILYFCNFSSANQEEDLKEKLSQLELYAKEVKQEMIKLRNNVAVKLRNFKRKEYDWLQDYFRLKKRIPRIESILDEAKRQAEDLIQKLKNERRDLRVKFHKYKVVHGGKYHTKISHDLGKTKDVSFRSIYPLKTRLEPGENIILTDTPENNGNAYDNYTGIFVAPVTGTYYFVLQLCLGGNYVDLTISKGEESYSWARFFPYYMSCQTLDMLVPLQKGDDVYPAKISSWDYDIMSDDNELYNSFSGVLLA